MKVTIVEVGPRDGLQNEAKTLRVQERVQMIQGLVASGLKRVEVGAFVSPRWVPQMMDTHLVVEALQADQPFWNRHSDKFSVLVPNIQGMQQVMKTQIREVAIFGACSETFSKKNINCSIAESFERFEEVMRLARARRVRVRGYLSTVFGCPYEGEVKQAQVLRCLERMLKLGVFEVSLGDTIGVATPKQVEALLKKAQTRFSKKKIALHFHDTRGTALANVLKSLELGFRTFDASVGGLGGCPYAKGASGNLATEDLVYFLDGMGAETGVNLDHLVALTHRLETLLGRALPSRVSKAQGSFTRL